MSPGGTLSENTVSSSPAYRGVEPLEHVGLEGGDDDRGVEVFREIARGNADFPPLAFPLEPLVVGESPGRHRVNCLFTLSRHLSRIDQVFKDKGFAGSGRGGNDDVFALVEKTDCFLLPEIGDL